MWTFFSVYLKAFLIVKRGVFFSVYINKKMSFVPFEFDTYAAYAQMRHFCDSTCNYSKAVVDIFTFDDFRVSEPGPEFRM